MTENCIWSCGHQYEAYGVVQNFFGVGSSPLIIGRLRRRIQSAEALPKTNRSRRDDLDRVILQWVLPLSHLPFKDGKGRCGVAVTTWRATAALGQCRTRINHRRPCSLRETICWRLDAGNGEEMLWRFQPPRGNLGKRQRHDPDRSTKTKSSLASATRSAVSCSKHRPKE